MVVHRDRFLDDGTDQIPVRPSDRILTSDDAILAVLVHETTEILALEQELKRAGRHP